MPALVEQQRILLALRLDPARRFRHLGHRPPGIGQRFQPAILGMRAACLERHHEGLAGGVHHRVGQGRAQRIESLENLQAGAHARPRAGVTPAWQGLLLALQQFIRVVLIVGHAQFEAIGRALGARAADRLRPGQGEMPAQQCLELGLGTHHRLFRVLPEALLEVRPVTALGNRLHGALQGVAMVIEQL